MIAAAGFSAVRLPVRWWGRTAELLPPVRALVETAWSTGLAVVLKGMAVLDIVRADEALEQRQIRSARLGQRELLLISHEGQGSIARSRPWRSPRAARGRWARSRPR